MCKRCVMDTTDPLITFDENGFCNHCRDYIQHDTRRLCNPFKGIKTALLGVSGGVDSSYVAYLAWKHNVKVQLLNVDNGWDTPEAKKNVQVIADITGFPIEYQQLDWNEFRSLQLVFLEASVIGVEMITDHAIAASLYRMAMKKGLKHILTGVNYATEKILPLSWGHRFNDLRNIKAIHKQYGTVPLKTFPTMSLSQLFWNRVVRRIRMIKVLDCVEYNREKAKQVLKENFGWQDYGAKHYESVWTRFYQAYILPQKFGIDKRRMHLSTLICSGQIAREEALKELEKPPYSKEELERDKKQVLTKLEITEEEFQRLMEQPIRRHEDFATNSLLYTILKKLRNLGG